MAIKDYIFDNDTQNKMEVRNEIIDRIIRDLSIRYDNKKSNNKITINEQSIEVLANEIRKGLRGIENDIVTMCNDTIVNVLFNIDYIAGKEINEKMLGCCFETSFETPINIFNTYGADFDYKNIDRDDDFSIWSNQQICKLEDFCKENIDMRVFFHKRIKCYLARYLASVFVTYQVLENNLGIIRQICKSEAMLTQITLSDYFSHIYYTLVPVKYYNNMDVDFMENIFRESVMEINKKISIISLMLISYYYYQTEERKECLYQEMYDWVEGYLNDIERIELANQPQRLLINRKDERIRGLKGKKRNDIRYCYAILQERIIEYSKCK